MRITGAVFLLATTACAQNNSLWTPLKTYTDPAHGVTFQYPASWQADGRVAYFPGALGGDNAKRLAGFGLDLLPENPPKIIEGGSLVNHFGILYSALPASDKAACSAIAMKLLDAEEPGKIRHVKLGGITYTTHKISEFGMMKALSGTLYETFQKGTCLLFETDEETVNLGAFDEDDVRQWKANAAKDSRGVADHLLDVMKSVRIR